MQEKLLTIKVVTRIKERSSKIDLGTVKSLAAFTDYI